MATKIMDPLYEKDEELSAESLLHFLRNPSITQEHIRIYDSLESTNQEAKRLARKGAPKGTIVLAEEQTKGRGRLGRSFFSPRGAGIYMSAILKPENRNPELMMSTLVAAVAVCKGLYKVAGVSAKIKWVNDIFIDNRKVCGILTEAVSDPIKGSIESVIIGIGVNVNTETNCFPADIGEIAGSLCKAGHKISRNLLAAAIIDELYDLILYSDPSNLISEYKSLCFTIGRHVTVNRHDETYGAKALDIDPLGGLIVERGDGSLETIRFGDVSVRPLGGSTDEQSI
jgi:BirA family biotin operon repressor/biotin-[acetyl-CoA-carboxylase] ligase